MSVLERFQQLETHASRLIVGQAALIERLLIALLADGHLLVEGAPGLAKTSAIRALAARIEADFHRVQFTPDLLPADLTGTDVWRPQDGSFEFQPGRSSTTDPARRRDQPRARQGAVGAARGHGRAPGHGGRVRPMRLPALFLVMATQNPIEQEGTYPAAGSAARPLPDARARRLSRRRGRAADPDAGARRGARRRRDAFSRPSSLSQSAVFAARGSAVLEPVPGDRTRGSTSSTSCSRRAIRAPVDDGARRPILYGREPARHHRARPRARAHAWLAGRDYVTPEDVHAVAQDVLRHRVVLTFEAEADGVDADSLIERC